MSKTETKSAAAAVKALKAELVNRLHLDPNSPSIVVGVEGDALVMEGTVESIAIKKRALMAALEKGGFTGVVDRVMVRPASAMEDDEIRDHVRDALDGEQTLQGLDIKIEVEGGVVDLEGTVGSLSHKRLAGVLAWWVPGSLDVINSLELDPPEEDNDDEIKDAVRLALEKDRLVEASEVTVTSTDWKVILRGAVGSESEKQAAEDDAWYVWGVNDVDNRLTVA